MGIERIAQKQKGIFSNIIDQNITDQIKRIDRMTPEDVKTRNKILNNLNNNYNHFDYDAEKDALFQAQRRQLERNQRSGVSDVLAQYAANTGMGGSSAAMSAAQQTASSYNAMIVDALGTAENRAYNRWAQEKADLQTQLAYAQNVVDQREAAEAAAEASQEEIGMNGITKSQYDAKMQRLQLAYQYADNEDSQAAILERMDALEKSYYGLYTPADLQGVADISAVEADSLVRKAKENGNTLSEEEYKKLTAYYYHNPVGDYRGEAVLKAYGISKEDPGEQVAAGEGETVSDENPLKTAIDYGIQQFTDTTKTDTTKNEPWKKYGVTEDYYKKNARRYGYTN